MNTDPRWHSAASERNKGPIVAELLRLLPREGLLLEIACGTGQHAAFAAAALPAWQWQPSDADPAALASTSAWCAGRPNVRPPLQLDVTQPTWPGVPAQLDAIFCANMLHIAPWDVCLGLLQGAARHLGPHGQLILYGPYRVEGEATAPSNLAFDADLRQRNPAWGLRQLSDVLREARGCGLGQRDRVQMPANNLLLVLERLAG